MSTWKVRRDVIMPFSEIAVEDAEGRKGTLRIDDGYLNSVVVIVTTWDDSNEQRAIG